MISIVYIILPAGVLMKAFSGCITVSFQYMLELLGNPNHDLKVIRILMYQTTRRTASLVPHIGCNLICC